MKKTIFILLLLFNVMPGYAETIQLKSGETIQGKIVERSDKLIKVDRGVGVDITYYSDEIEKIDGKAFAPADASGTSSEQKQESAQLETRVIEGQVGHRSLFKDGGNIGQISLLLPDGIKLEFWVKESVSLEGKNSYEDILPEDFLSVEYSVSDHKKYAEHIKFLYKVKWENSILLPKKFVRNIQDQTNEIIKEGIVSDFTWLESSSGHKLNTSGIFTLNLPDDTGVMIQVANITLFEGLKSSLGEISSGDTLSVTYVLIDHHNYAKRIKVLAISDRKPIVIQAQ